MEPTKIDNLIAMLMDRCYEAGMHKDDPNHEAALHAEDLKLELLEAIEGYAVDHGWEMWFDGLEAGHLEAKNGVEPPSSGAVARNVRT
jgi:hypothetical protein